MQAFFGGMLMAAMQSVLAATTPETLPKEKRLPYNLGKINPLGGLSLLFTHGAGLRRLVIVSTQAIPTTT